MLSKKLLVLSLTTEKNFKTDNRLFNKRLLKTEKLILMSFKDIFVPTFDTKVTEYLCSGWVFFSSDKFRLFN